MFQYVEENHHPRHLFIIKYLSVSKPEDYPIIKIFRGSGSKTIVEENSVLIYHGFNDDQSNYVVRWKESYLSMVFLGGRTWGGFLKYENSTHNYPQENEFICKEAKDLKFY